MDTHRHVIAVPGPTVLSASLLLSPGLNWLLKKRRKNIYVGILPGVKIDLWFFISSALGTIFFVSQGSVPGTYPPRDAVGGEGQGASK